MKWVQRHGTKLYTWQAICPTSNKFTNLAPERSKLWYDKVIAKVLQKVPGWIGSAGDLKSSIQQFGVTKVKWRGHPLAILLPSARFT